MRLEPDECHCLIAIEVIITSTLIDKLAVYEGLGVPEVWVWQNDQLWLYHLRETGYEQIFTSEFLPNLDLELLCRCVRMNDQHDAVLAFRAALKS